MNYFREKMPELNIPDLSIIMIWLIFFIGLFLRGVVFVSPHMEGDERIYSTLVEQLNSGHGYTLLGSSLLEKGAIVNEQYNTKLFHHPPGGIALFWLFGKIFGKSGYGLVQLFSYAVFFCSMISLGKFFCRSSSKIGLITVASLSAFNPIMTHVTTHYWLDGPLLAFSSLSLAVFLQALDKRNAVMILVAGLIFAYACLIKQTAFFIVPGALLLAWFVLGKNDRTNFLRYVLYFLIPAVIVHIPWIVWRYTLGLPFLGSAGKPLKALIDSNQYIYFVTVVRSPWIYLTLLPRIIWTLIPSLVLYLIVWKDSKIRILGSFFIIWIVFILGVHITLGYAGYSKLLRYVILITPATIILFSLLLDDIVQKLHDNFFTGPTRGAVMRMLFISGVAVLMEIATGVKSSIYFLSAIITPIIGTN